MTTAIVSADELCTALETVLTDHLADEMVALGYTAAVGYEPVRDWQQVPTINAIATAKLPAGAITTPGLADSPTWVPSHRAYRTTWRIAAGVYVRGRDHDQTQRMARNYAAAVRVTVLRHKGLGGIAEKLRWVGEDYALRPERESSRTLAACAVAFDVTAMTIGTGRPVSQQPEVLTTPTTLSVQ